MTLTAAEVRLLAAIDEGELVADLAALIQTPSVTGTAAESELQHRQARMLTESGMQVDTWSIDVEALRSDPAFPGEETGRTEGYGVVGVTGSGLSDGQRPALILQGHVDVVPVGTVDLWDSDPFSGSIIGDRLFGRGACDMKAGVAATMAVARAVGRSGVALTRPLAVHMVVSEEDGGLGAFATLRRGHTGDVAVIPEPTSGALVTATAGALTFELTVIGRAAHGSVRLEGFSAFEAFLPLHDAIQAFERERNSAVDDRFPGNRLPYPISIGRVHAGDWASSVPDQLVAEGRLGIRIGEPIAEVRLAFEDLIRITCERDPWLRGHPATLTWPGGQFASGSIAADHPLLAEMVSAAVDVGAPRPLERAAPYGSDLRLYADLGQIPTLHFGPGDVRFAHAPREQVSLSETFRVARALALLAARRCGAYLPRSSL